MNRAFFELSEDLKQLYNSAFHSQNDSEIFLFFRKLLAFLESDSSSYNTLFLFENPLKNQTKREFMQNVHGKCWKFLNEKKNNPDKAISGAAMCYIGMGHDYGMFELEGDVEKAVEAYIMSSQLGDGLGTYRLGQCFELGRGVERDYDRALHLYRCAAKQGNVEALHIYGTVLTYGCLGMEEDERMGLHYMTQAALKASSIYPYPLYDIGRWYEIKRETLDTITDERYSFEMYKRGGALADPNSQYRIAKAYENGELQKEKSVNSAVVWYKRAAENGQIDAQLMLFGFYASGTAGVEKDFSRSYYWALRAGTRGNARAVFFLGEYAMSGLGVQRDVLLGLWWYTISASMGSYEARIKMKETRAEIEKRDFGPDIVIKCCGIVFCRYYRD